ncbi:PREDICTED: heat shock 70 kDa protein-like [Erythranthe guttata]|uniref:heat shock 70 kDa protein-like n=1 Tax=Erythranthe guttata TaxID=4155 RepID=UPI00064DB541|nr:PREDICTED: heat shock 70 kDa protein-like [Erythranthe guttata]|eukprot:XP_012854109.1 PREDICTED: heat shock 70 kDa protein-like [Erythranthe guttata]
MYAPSPTAAAGDGVDLHIINNPVCASIAYALDKKPSEDEERNVMVYNHGGDDLSVAVLTVEEGGVFSMRSAARETQLAGDEFTNRLLNHFAAEFSRKHNKDLSTAAASLRRLREACERVKRALSSKTKTTIEINSLYEGIDFYGSITRVLVGGTLKIPKLQKLLADLVGGTNIRKNIDPVKAISFGAHLCKDTQLNRVAKIRLLDFMHANIGIKTGGGGSVEVLIPEKTIRLFHGSRVPMDTNNSSKITERNWRIPVAPQGTARVKLRIEIDYLTLSVFIMDNLIFKTTNLCGAPR